MIERGWLETHPAEVAPRLLGWLLVSGVGPRTVVKITEVEAYAADDPASHSFRGVTSRNGSMFGRAGTLYVYRSYGIHWCANVTTGPEGEGSAVLIRAGEPLEGADVMATRRGRVTHLADGPGKLCQALAVDGTLDGTDLLDPGSPVHLVQGSPPRSVKESPRVGITKAVDTPWRFEAIDG